MLTQHWVEGTAWILPMVLALSALLWWRLPASERPTVRGTLVFYLLALVVHGAALVALAVGAERTTGVLHELAELAAGIALIRLWGLMLFRVVLRTLKLAPPHLVEDIVLVLAYIAWGMLRLRYAGVELTGLVATSAVITAVIAFAMQDTLGNLLGGLALQADRSIAIGDWIRIDDVSGRVVDIGWRSTLIETRNWETVVVPNSVLMKNRFLVLGRRVGQPVKWRRWVYFSVDYGHPPGRVIEAAERCLRDADIPHLAREPAPNAVLMDTSQGVASYALRYWLTDPEHDDPTDSRVRQHLFAALQRQGVRIAAPEYRLHAVTEDAAYAEEQRQRERGRRLEALSRIELFDTLTREEREQVASGLVFAPFAAGGVITRQGAEAHWLYVLVSGEAEVWLTRADGSRKRIGTLASGEFFGEMGLLTGAPRSATVIARSDCECYRLDKAAFAAILRARPGLAEELAPVLQRRRQELEDALEAEPTIRPAAPRNHGDLVARIRQFFGL